MLKEISSKTFANGKVYLLQTEDGYPIEVTDTFLPYYTKNCVGRKTNKLKSREVGSRSERWMIGVSVMSGCPVGCKFCATGKLKKWRNLSYREIVQQVLFVLSKNPNYDCTRSKEFKINYTRMGEPFLNISHVKYAIEEINRNFEYSQSLSGLFNNKVHHYISTIGVKDSDFSWIKDNITLQLSLHSLDEERRNELIPFTKKMTIEELGRIRTRSNLKTTLNLTLVNMADFDIDKLRQYFDPQHFFIKLSPINENDISKENNLGGGVIESENLVLI